MHGDVAAVTFVIAPFASVVTVFDDVIAVAVAVAAVNIVMLIAVVFFTLLLLL